jgi:hypothetical protein
MKTDVALDPIYVDLFRAGAVAAEAHGCPDPVEQFRGLGTGQSGICHLAAFLADVPSMRQEIDCKLQSNSR